MFEITNTQKAPKMPIFRSENQRTKEKDELKMNNIR